MKTRVESSRAAEVPPSPFLGLVDRVGILRAGTALATLAAVAVVLSAASPALAADQYWDGGNVSPNNVVDGGADGWDGRTNWTNQDGSANSTWLGGVAIFAGASGGLVGVSGTQNFDTLRFEVDGYRVNGGILNMDPLSGTNATIQVDSGLVATVGAVLQGSDDLKVEGPGTLILTGMNTYTGATTIAAGGTLALSGQGRINQSSGVTVSGTLDVSNAPSAEIKTLNGNGAVNVGGNYLRISTASGGFGGIISGTGGIMVTGGTQVLTGTNTFTGSAGIGEGATLQIGNGGTSGSIISAVSVTGTLVFNRSDDVTFAGTITGTGGVQHIGTGKLTLTGANSGGRDATIAAGSTLQLGTGGTGGWIGGTSVPGTITNHGTLIYNRSNNVRWGGKYAGTGALLQQGTGWLTLTGDSSLFAGSTTVKSGTLNVGRKEVGILAGPVEVKSGARLGGSGTINGKVTVAAGATHSVGDAIDPTMLTETGLKHTQTINGNYVNHGNFEVEANPGGSDKLTVNGTVDITGATLNLLLTPNNSANPGPWLPQNGPFTIIDNDGTDAVIGTFASVGNLNNLVFLDHLINYAGGVDGNDVTLTLKRNDLSVAEVAQTGNQAAVGGAIDSLPDGNPVASALFMLTEDQARDALDQLSGDVHASASGASTQTSSFLGEFATDRVRSAFGDVAAPALPVMAYGDDGIELVAADTDRFVVWGQALGNWGSVDGDGNSGGFDHSSGGLVAGGDTIVGDGWRLGLLAGYSRTSFDTDDGASSGDSDNFHLGVYGGRHFGAVALRAGAAYTRHAIDTTRTVSFPGLNQTLKADYAANTAQAFVETGYRTEMGRVAFEPFAGLAYVSTSTDAFTETGGAAALSSKASTFDSTTTTLGLRAATDFSLGQAQATARGGLGWRHAFGDVAPTSTVAFIGGDDFTVYGSPIARDALLVEAGLDFAISPKANFGLGYTGQVASGARDHGVKASFGVMF